MPRRPEWPTPWLELAVLCGGSVALREALGYKSKTTLSAKISDSDRWRRADALLLASLLSKHPGSPKLEVLLPRPVLEKLLTPKELIEVGVTVVF